MWPASESGLVPWCIRILALIANTEETHRLTSLEEVVGPGNRGTTQPKVSGSQPADNEETNHAVLRAQGYQDNGPSIHYMASMTKGKGKKKTIRDLGKDRGSKVEGGPATIVGNWGM